MKSLIVVLFTYVTSLTCLAQQFKINQDSIINNTTGNPGLRYQAKPYNGPILYSTGNGYRQQGKLFKDTTGFFTPNSPYYLITLNDQIIPYSAWPTLSLIGVQQIDEMKIYSGKKADSLYAGSGEKGLIIIKIKKDLPVYTKSSFLKKYNIKRKYNKLPVYIDSVIAYHTDKLMLSTSDIKSITVTTDNETGLKFINILTTFPHIKYNPNEHYIRGLASSGKN
ncbi:MAG: hypothetical protein JWR50_3236 [Mucilaginibacter sp.]|nr:hypothetical protein [Mucilaginibacter sp.]